MLSSSFFFLQRSRRCMSELNIDIAVYHCGGVGPYETPNLRSPSANQVGSAQAKHRLSG